MRRNPHIKIYLIAGNSLSSINYNNLEINYECLIIIEIGQSAAKSLEPLGMGKVQRLVSPIVINRHRLIIIN